PARTRAFWRVRIWSGGQVSDWSAPAYWETGLLEPGDWSAGWLGNAEWEKPRPLVTALGAQQARYVRVVVTDLGRPDSPLLDPVRSFDQVLVYPRWDAPGRWGITPDYPRTYTVSVADAADGPFTVVGKVSKDDKPYPPSSLHPAPAGLPLFARRFDVRGGVD